MTTVVTYECLPVPAAKTIFSLAKYNRREPEDIIGYYIIVISKRSFRSNEANYVS